MDGNILSLTACPKAVHFEKFAAAHCATKLFNVFFPPCFATPYGHYTSNLLPTPMSEENMYQRHKQSIELFNIF